jgi:hypothetical protein
VSSTALRERLGPLVERQYRLLFAATTVTPIGDAVAGIALAFAVLDLPGAGATDLGIVLATRQAANAAVPAQALGRRSWPRTASARAVGGIVAYRYRPQGPMVACVAGPTLYVLQLVALAAGAPT